MIEVCTFNLLVDRMSMSCHATGMCCHFCFREGNIYQEFFVIYHIESTRKYPSCQTYQDS
jgi:hypothetical protein